MMPPTTIMAASHCRRGGAGSRCRFAHAVSPVPGPAQHRRGAAVECALWRRLLRVAASPVAIPPFFMAFRCVLLQRTKECARRWSAPVHRPSQRECREPARKPPAGSSSFGGTSVPRVPAGTPLPASPPTGAERQTRVVVVSALSGITDKLKDSLPNADAARRSRARQIVRRHEAMAGRARPGAHHVAALLAHLIAPGWTIRAPPPATCPGRPRCWPWRTVVQHPGQGYLSARACRRCGWTHANTCWHGRFPNQNAWGRYLSASVPTAPGTRVDGGADGAGRGLHHPGFMARNEAGETVILGRGGSGHLGCLLRCPAPGGEGGNLDRRRRHVQRQSAHRARRAPVVACLDVRRRKSTTGAKCCTRAASIRCARSAAGG